VGLIDFALQERLGNGVGLIDFALQERLGNGVGLIDFALQERLGIGVREVGLVGPGFVGDGRLGFFVTFVCFDDLEEPYDGFFVGFVEVAL
jgi:hypothetical protein